MYIIHITMFPPKVCQSSNIQTKTVRKSNYDNNENNKVKIVVHTVTFGTQRYC